MSQFRRTNFLKRAIQILLPASLLPLVFHFSRVHFSTLSGYTTDRNYVFLLCNGILVLIVAISGPTATSSSETNHSDYDKEKDKTELQSAPEMSTKSSVAGYEVALESEKTKSIVQIVEEGVEEIIDGSYSTLYREYEMVLITDHDNREEENREEECMGMLSTEELNKKCEEFIKKMREGIKNEETQQLIISTKTSSYSFV